MPLEPPAIRKFIVGFWIVSDQCGEPDSEWRKFYYLHKKREFEFDVIGPSEQEFRLTDDGFQEAASAVINDPEFQSAVLDSLGP